MIDRWPNGRKRIPVAEKFWPKVNKAGPVFMDLGPCWLWIAAKNNKGYGNFGVMENKKTKMLCAHRVSWELAGKELPNKKRDGLVLDHICKTPLCVNPDHLRVVTQHENCTILAKESTPCRVNMFRTKCVNGHPLATEGDTLNRPGKKGRECRLCYLGRMRDPTKSKYFRAESRGGDS